MYNFDLNENEIIIYNNDEAKILSKDKIIDVSLVITNERLIIFQDGSKLGNVNTLLRTIKAMSFIPNREIIFEVKLENISTIESGEYLKIVFNNNTFIEIDDKNIISVIESR